MARAPTDAGGWEGALPPRGPRPRGSRALARAAVVAVAATVAVVLVGGLMRGSDVSETPAPDTVGPLRIDPSGDDRGARPGSRPRIDRGGDWHTVGRRPPVDLLRAEVATWTGEEVVVGFSPRVAAWSPARVPREGWRELPAHPADPIAVRGAVTTGTCCGATPRTHVIGAKACAGCPWTHPHWVLTTTDGTWQRLADPPDAGGDDAAAISGQDAAAVLATPTRVLLLRDDGAGGVRLDVWGLATGAWTALGGPPGRLDRWAAHAVGERVVLLGVDDAGRPAAWVHEAGGWRDAVTDLPFAEPHRAGVAVLPDRLMLLGPGLLGAELRAREHRWRPLPAVPPDPLLPDLDGRVVEGLLGTWDGQRAVFVGGLDVVVHLALAPATGEWQVRRPPTPRTGGTALWTGAMVVLWGGADRSGPILELRVWPPL